MNVLIVENEIISRIYLAEILNTLDYLNINSIYEVDNANEALKYIEEYQIDMVFMDIDIEGHMNGIDCAKEIYKKKNLSVIYTTAFKDTHTIVRASQTNPHGYLIKPFLACNVEATLAISLKKSQNNITNKLVKIKDIKYDKESKTLYHNDENISLTNKELTIIDVFFNNINQNISYDTLKDKIWQDQSISNSTVRDIISKVKRKVTLLPIENISSYGYIMKVS